MGRESARPPGERRDGRVLGDHERGLFGELPQEGSSSPGPLHVEGIRDPAALERARDVAGAFEDERVMAVGGERVALRHGVVDEHGRIERVRDCDGRVQGGVLVTADGDAHPVEDVGASCRGTAFGKDARAGAHVLGKERERCGCLGIAHAGDGRVRAERRPATPSRPRSRRRRPTVLSFVMMMRRSSQPAGKIAVVGPTPWA